MSTTCESLGNTQCRIVVVGSGVAAPQCELSLVSRGLIIDVTRPAMLVPSSSKFTTSVLGDRAELTTYRNYLLKCTLRSFSAEE